MRLLVTGGAGFIGSNFIHHWISEHPEHRIVNLDALTYAGNLENLKSVESSPNYKFIHGNICDPDQVRLIFETEEIDTVVNFAAESHVDRSILGPETFLKTNIFGTFTLLEAAKGYWGEGQSCRFLHVSTDEVYGTLGPGDAAFTEETSFAPNSPYAASKASSDHLVRAYFHTYGLPVVTTNCSNNYGPYQFPEKLIPLVILNALEDKEIPVYGKGLNVRDWLHVKDHCRGIEAALRNGRTGETYNIGGGNEKQNIDVVGQICDRLDQINKSAESRRNLIRFVKDRPGHDLRYAIDSTKIEAELKWKPIYSFEDGLKETIDWYLANQEWCARVRDGAYRDYYQTQYG